MRSVRVIAQRVFCILALFACFVVIGAPGGGGRGGGGGGGGFGGGYGGSGLGGTRLLGAPVPGQELIGFLLIAGLIGFMFWLVGRGAYPFRPEGTLPDATVRLTVVALLEGDAQEHAAFFDKLLKKSSFTIPLERAEALNRVLTYLESAVISDGFTQERRYSTGAQASQTAELLSVRQIRCVDGSGAADPTGMPCCLVGFTITTTPERAGYASSLTGKDAVEERFQQLRGTSERSMDAFYLFYSPAPGDILRRAQASKTLSTLQKLGTSSAVKTA